MRSWNGTSLAATPLATMKLPPAQTAGPLPSSNVASASTVHLLGIDHTRLTYFHQGRDFRLTDVEGVVVEKLLA